MKELSIEEKVKCYDEALEKAKMVLQERGNEPDGASVLSDLFPELAESEDERIRKDCIKYLDWEYQHCSTNEDKIKIEKCIDWLEKQGKENPLKGTLGDVFDDIKLGIDPSPKQGEQKPYECDNEQKPVEWSEEDEKMIRALVSMCDVWATSHQFYPKENKEMEALKTWLKSLRPQNRWKPSEEQMAQLQKYCLDNRPLTLLYEQLKTL